MTRTIAFVALTSAITSAAIVPGEAGEVVEIRLRGHYYSEPATVRISVAVEPDAQNRALRIQADGERYFRESELTLAGASDKRIHTVEFKNLPAGAYILRAQVLSAEAVRGQATHDLVVTGAGAR